MRGYWLEKSQFSSHFLVNLKVIVSLARLSWSLTLYFNIQSFGKVVIFESSLPGKLQTS